MLTQRSVIYRNALYFISAQSKQCDTVVLLLVFDNSFLQYQNTGKGVIIMVREGVLLRTKVYFVLYCVRIVVPLCSSKWPKAIYLLNQY